MKKLFLGAIAAFMLVIPAHVAHAETLTPGQQFSYALHLLADRRYDDAIKILEGMKKLEKTESQKKQVDDLLYVAVWNNARGYELYDPKRAMEQYQKAEKLRPDDRAATSNRGFLLCKLKRFDECNALFKELVDRTTGDDRVDSISEWAIANQVGGNIRNARVIAEEGKKFAESIGITSGPGYRGFRIVLEGPYLSD